MYILRIIFLLLLTGPLYALDEPDGTVAPADTGLEPALAGSDASVASDSNESTDNAGAQGTPPIEPQARALPIPSTRRIIETVKHLGLFQREEEVIKFSDEESSISGLYLPENTGHPQGGILILHDISQHAQWPHTVAPLREYLPDYGWTTLSLFFSDYIAQPLPDTRPKKEMPDTPDSEVNPLADTELATTADNNIDGESTAVGEDTGINEAMTPDDENFDSTNSSDALDDVADNFEAFSVPDTLENDDANNEVETPPDIAFLESMQERVEGGLRQLNTLGQFNLVIIAHGLSANWAVETLRTRFSENPNVIGYSLILIDAKQSLYPSYQLNDELAKLKIPILDLYTKSSEDMKRELQSRKNAVTRQQPLNYIQIGLPSLKTIHNNKHNMISRRVRGWLKTHAAGEEVTVKERRG